MMQERGAIVMVKPRGVSHQILHETHNIILECSGLNEVENCLRIENLLFQWEVDIVSLSETKLGIISRSIIGFMRVSSSGVVLSIASRGAPRGILQIWEYKVGREVLKCV